MDLSPQHRGGRTRACLEGGRRHEEGGREEDRRQRAELVGKEQRELEQRRKGKGKGKAREETLEVGLSRPWKQRAESEEEGASSKRPKVSSCRI